MSEQPTPNPIVAGIGASIARTAVPVVMGFILSWAAKAGLNLDDLSALIARGLDLVAIVLYYAVVRALETFVRPAWGWLIGYAKVPAYPTAVNTSAVDAA